MKMEAVMAPSAGDELQAWQLGMPCRKINLKLNFEVHNTRNAYKCILSFYRVKITLADYPFGAEQGLQKISCRACTQVFTNTYVF